MELGHGNAVDGADVVAGRILWLPPLTELPPGIVVGENGTPAIKPEAFNHPVVICSRPWAAAGEMAHFHIITSFKGKSLEERITTKTDRRMLKGYIPISPAPYHSNNDLYLNNPRPPMLELGHGAKMQWLSYVNGNEVFSIPWKYLTTYWSRARPSEMDYRLDKKSLRAMLVHTERLIGYQQAIQYPQTQHIFRPVQVSPPMSTVSLGNQTVADIESLSPSPPEATIPPRWAQPKNSRDRIDQNLRTVFVSLFTGVLGFVLGYGVHSGLSVRTNPL